MKACAEQLSSNNLTIAEISEIYDVSFDTTKELTITDLITSYGEIDLIDDFDRDNVFLNEILSSVFFLRGRVFGTGGSMAALRRTQTPGIDAGWSLGMPRQVLIQLRDAPTFL